MKSIEILKRTVEQYRSLEAVGNTKATASALFRKYEGTSEYEWGVECIALASGQCRPGGSECQGHEEEEGGASVY